MAKKVYVGIGGKARKVKKIYIGIGGVARKVKKAYIGVGGVARIFWSGGELSYYGTAETLSTARHNIAGTTVGNYALLGGGGDQGTGTYSNVDVYNGSLTKTTATELQQNRQCNATKVGSYALFTGGVSLDFGSVNTVDAYNESLTRSSPTSQTTMGISAATNVGNYALFAGGNWSSNVDAYNSSLTKTTATNLSNSRLPAATTIGDYALFGGGYSGSTEHSTVESYNSSLTKTIQTSLSQKRKNLLGTAVGNYAIFGGGTYTDDDGGFNTYQNADVYDSSLTKISTTLNTGRAYEYGLTSIGEYAIFAGSDSYSKSVTVINASLTVSSGTDLSVGRSNLVGVQFKDTALFAGGKVFYNSKSSVVDVYMV